MKRVLHGSRSIDVRGGRAPLAVDDGCSVGVALAMAHIQGALVMAVVDEARVVVGAVTRETLERSSRFSTCGQVMTVFDVAVCLRITVRPAPSIMADQAETSAPEERRPAA